MKSTLVGGAIALLSLIAGGMLTFWLGSLGRRQEQHFASAERWREKSASALGGFQLLLQDLDLLVFAGLAPGWPVQQAKEAEEKWKLVTPTFSELALLHPDERVRNTAGAVLGNVNSFMVTFGLLREEAETGEDLGLHGDMTSLRSAFQKIEPGLHALAAALRGDLPSNETEDHEP